MQNIPKIPGLSGLRIPKEIPKDLAQKLLEGAMCYRDGVQAANALVRRLVLTAMSACS